MERNRVATLVAGVLAAAALLTAVSSVDATSNFAVRRWDVTMTATMTTSWSFSAEIPDTCAQYLGSPERSAAGKGSYRLTVRTAPGRHISVRTFRANGKLRFSSFSTGRWSLPASATKTGSASTRSGRPCGAAPEDPEPLPAFADSSGCSTVTGTSRPTLSWTPGTLLLRLGSGPLPPDGWVVRCPDVATPALAIVEDTTCAPKGLGTMYLSALKFMLPRPRAFTVRTKHRYLCPIPVGDVNWRDGSASLAITIDVDDSVTFTPVKR